MTAVAEPAVMPAASKTSRRGGTRKAAAAGDPSAAPPTVTAGPSAVQLVPVALLDDHPLNPREELTELEDLAQSIAEQGLLQNLTVVPSHVLRGADAVDDGRFTVLIGHRRKAAAAIAKLLEVPCVVRRDVTTAGQALQIMLVENLQRVDISPLSEARAYAQLVDEGMSQHEIAARVGRNQSHISKRLQLLKLHPKLLAAIAAGDLSVPGALELGKLTEQGRQLRAYERATTTKHGYGAQGDVGRAVRLEQQQIETDAKTATETARLKKAGIPLLPARPDYGKTRELYQGGAAARKEHAAAGCLAAYISPHSADVAYFCVKPTSHKGSAARDSSPQAAKEREDRRERKKAIEARVAACIRVVAWPVSPADASDVLARALLTSSYDHAASAQLAATWLRANGEDRLSDNGWSAARDALAHTDAGLRRRMACALALAYEESKARANHTRWGREQALYLHRLVSSVQYEPTAWERSRLEEEAGLDVDVFLASTDPLTALAAEDEDDGS